MMPVRITLLRSIVRTSGGITPSSVARPHRSHASAALIERAPPCDSVGIDVPESPLCKEKEEPVEKHTVVGVDLAKTKFEVAISDEPGRVSRQPRRDRSELLSFFAQLQVRPT